MSRPDPLRVARVIARLNVGGPAQHVVWLTEALQDEEFESVLITGTVPPGEDDMSAFAAAHGVRPLVIPEMSREISPHDVVTVWKLFRFFRRYRPAIIHTHTAKAGAAGRAAGFLYRILTPRARVKFVHTFHGHVFHSYYGALKTRLFLLIENVLARFTDAILVLSEQQLCEIHETFRIGKREQFHIVPLGLDLDAVQGAPEARATPVIAIIGRLTAVKNHDLFLRVAARFGDEARFVVYGDGADRAALEARGKHVEFAGTRPAREIYGAIDIAALTSLNEGTPLTLIEAMANGIPVISTAVGGVVDLLGAVEEKHDGFDIRERGITATSNDEIGFAAGLHRLLDDAALRQRFSERGRVFARAHYSKERLVGDIRRLYRELTASS